MNQIPAAVVSTGSRWPRCPAGTAGRLLVTVLGMVSTVAGVGVDAAEDAGRAARGWAHLLERSYLPSDFDQEIFDDLWTTWEEPLRARAERASVA